MRWDAVVVDVGCVELAWVRVVVRAMGDGGDEGGGNEEAGEGCEVERWHFDD